MSFGYNIHRNCFNNDFKNIFYCKYLLMPTTAVPVMAHGAVPALHLPSIVRFQSDFLVCCHVLVIFQSDILNIVYTKSSANAIHVHVLHRSVCEPTPRKLANSV